MNLGREYQDLLAGVLNAAGTMPVTAVVEVQPSTITDAQTSLNESGYAVIVSYPTMSYTQTGQWQFESAVMIWANPEVQGTDDVLEVAMMVLDAFQENQPADEKWTELRVQTVEPVGTEDGLVSYRVKVQSLNTLVLGTV